MPGVKRTQSDSEARRGLRVSARRESEVLILFTKRTQSDSEAPTHLIHWADLARNRYKMALYARQKAKRETQDKMPVAFFRAPAVIVAHECAGDTIVVGCDDGEVLYLRFNIEDEHLGAAF